MCNPRRVKERASRRIARAWEESVSHVAQLVLQASGQASVRIPFSETFSAAVRRAFERALSNDSRWRATDVGYETSVDDGRVAYLSATGDLEILIELTDIVAVSEQRTGRVRAESTSDISSEGEGTYDPEIRLRSEAEARQIALQNANRQLDAMEQAQANQLLQDARQEVLRRIGDEEARVREEAEAAAAATANELRARREQELTRRAQERLAIVRRQSTELAGAALGRAYQEVLVAAAVGRGAQNLETFTDDEGRIHIRFEAEA
ncbi:hypothetical protein Rhe02_89580 [Rhizocola hellebori]|uniref:FtsH ternary system domain-containing protein n=1 Tax=Rhizocola hellebori TaxID=1392758 RepID=A0A8J3QHT0_9ACTN|nr:hypothetical protein [Rhizocola hellebori]GIH10891.1 hypothetical protein Rhe02_89580 [Rhizocola hellebori]